MAGRANDLFPRFLREFVRPYLQPRGYTQNSRTFRKTDGPSTAQLIFMRYTGAHAGRFDVRMTLTLDRHAAELGAVVMEDLSRKVYGSVSRTPWHWPVEESEWPSLAMNLLEAVTAGAAWIESLLPLPALAAHLETERRFTVDADAQITQIAGAMESAGVRTLYSSPGYGASRTGKIRPDKVVALSYCCEAMEAWSRALDAWRDYMTTLHDPNAVDQPSVRKAHERLVYLEAKSRADQA